MTPEQYWQGKPELCVAYRALHRLKTDEKNNEMWLQGMYIYDGVFSAIGRLILGEKKMEYPKEPYQIRPKTKAELEAEAERERKKFIASMNAFKDAWNRK